MISDLETIDASLDSRAIKKEFPLLNKDHNGSPLIYLDSAATSQKPKRVIESIKNCYENNYANVHRGVYKLSQIATDKYENARMKVAHFLGIKENKQIIFTRGATEGLNLIAHCLSEDFIKKNDEVIISTLEHHSNIIPWQIACKRKGAKIIELKPTKEGEITFNHVNELLTPNTKIIALPHITNSIGSLVPIEDICKEARKRGIITVIDGCQAAPHIKINLEKIGSDFYVISGHKIYGPSGIGALYGKKHF